MTASPSFEAQARSLLLRFADQIGTITTKYHHKEVDYDKTNTWSNRYQEQALAALLSLYQAELEQAVKAARIDELEEMCDAAVTETVHTFVQQHKERQLSALKEKP